MDLLGFTCPPPPPPIMIFSSVNNLWDHLRSEFWGQNKNCTPEQNICLYVSFISMLLNLSYYLHASTCGCLHEKASPQTGLLISFLLPCRPLKWALKLWCVLSNTQAILLTPQETLVPLVSDEKHKTEGKYTLKSCTLFLRQINKTRRSIKNLYRKFKNTRLEGLGLQCAGG